MFKAPVMIAASSNDDDIEAINTMNVSTLDRNSVNNPSTVSIRSKRSQGWYMVALVFIANFLVFGFFKSLGMLAKILNKEFSATMNVYILMCITYSLNCAAGPLSCYLTTKYSARTMALIGTSMVTVGLILSWFAKSLAVLYFSVGVMTGIGSGLTYPTGIILVSNYFIETKNAAIANALVISGSPIGGMVMPYVISFLSELYTSRGAFLIVGGLMMHAVLCVRFFQQPGEKREHLPSPPPPPNTPRAEVEDSGKQEEPIVNDWQKTEQLNDNICDEQNNVINSKVHSCSTGMLHISGRCGGEFGITTSVQTITEYKACHHIPHSGLLQVSEIGSVTNEDGFGLTNRRYAIKPQNNNARDKIITKPYSGALAGAASQPFVLVLDHSCVVLCLSNTSTAPKQVTERRKSFSLAKDNDFILQEEAENNVPTPSTAIEKPVGSKCKCVSPLSEPLYIFLLLSNTATAISTANIYLMLAQLVKEEEDMDYTKTSFVYLLLSFADLTGRIMGALICDKYYVPPSAIYALGLLMAGASGSVLSNLATYCKLCLGTFLYGLSTGFHTGVYGLLLTNIVGLSKIHAGYGISMLINGSLQCIAILLSGSLISRYSSCFTWLSPVFGCILTGGGLFWIVGVLIFNKKAKDDGSPVITSSNFKDNDCAQVEDAVNNNVINSKK